VVKLCHLLSQQGFRALVHISEDRRKACEAARRLHQRHQADGVIFVGSRSDPAELDVGDVPFVVIGEVPEDGKVWQVHLDNEAGGRAVGEHLWGLGHRKVGVVMPLGNPSAKHKRLRGLRSVWDGRGEEFPDDRVLWVLEEYEQGVMEHLGSFLDDNERRGDRLTALFCFDDRVAAYVLRALRERGMQVPRDISVAGFDNDPYAEVMDPPLTTVHQPFPELATLAAQLLQDRLRSEPAPAKVLTLAGQLIVRESTAPPP